MTGKTRKNILFVVRELTLGGAAFLAIRHIQRLSASCRIELLITGSCDTGMTDLLPAEVIVHRANSGVPNQKTSVIDCHEWFAEQRNLPPFNKRYDAILGTSLFPDIQACVAFTRIDSPRKLLFLVDESILDSSLNREIKWAIESCILAADLTLPVSKGLWEKLSSQQPLLKLVGMKVLHPPIESDLIKETSDILPWGESNGLPVIVTVARLSPEKQILESIRIHHRLRQRGVDFLWYIIGSGADESCLRDEINRLGMEERFFLRGRQSSPCTWMKHCDGFALFSSSEGCPTVVIEALQLKKPVIMTAVNGADELIVHGHTGLIVENTEEAIAEGLSQFVMDTELRTHISRNLENLGAFNNASDGTNLLLEEINRVEGVPHRPKVSILIPTFNHGKRIHRAVASALMQDFRSLEVIVCDDASTDGTSNEIGHWTSDSRFRSVRHEKNLGRVENYRKALTEYAVGEWVLMLDGDDYLIDPGFIRKAMESLDRNASGQPLFVQAGHRVVCQPTDGKSKHAPSPVDIIPDIPGEELLMRGGDYLRFVYETGFFTHLGTLYNRREAIDSEFYSKDISSSDMDSLLRLALKGNILILKTIAGCWVQHGGNTSSNLPLRHIAENVRIFREIAVMAVNLGLFTMSQINSCLTRYEASTLACLFGNTIGKSSRGPIDAFRMMVIIVSVNPRVLMNKDLRHAWIEYFKTLNRMLWHKTKARWFTLSASARNGLI
jgi:glycosyltransferase involved in cell wall biosynthesis